MDFNLANVDLANLTILGAFGLVGVSLYISAYSLLQLGILRGGTYPYTLLNLTAACCVLTSLSETFNLSSAIIQITWITISIIGLTRLYLVNNMIRFDTMELVFLKTKLPGLRNDLAKKFLKMGKWKTGRVGDTLIQQNQPVQHLYYLAEGSADVYINGEKRAVCEKGDFIGEITYLSGAPATGTVVLSGSATYFCIEVDVIRKMTKYNNVLHNEIEKSIANDLRGKLSRSSQNQKAHPAASPNRAGRAKSLA